MQMQRCYIILLWANMPPVCCKFRHSSILLYAVNRSIGLCIRISVFGVYSLKSMGSASITCIDLLMYLSPALCIFWANRLSWSVKLGLFHIRAASLKVGFHYQSSRPEFTGRVDGPRTRVHFLTPVNSGRELG